MAKETQAKIGSARWVRKRERSYSYRDRELHACPGLAWRVVMDESTIPSISRGDFF
jgi:hypothetical protein